MTKKGKTHYFLTIFSVLVAPTSTAGKENIGWLPTMGNIKLIFFLSLLFAVLNLKDLGLGIRKVKEGSTRRQTVVTFSSVKLTKLAC